MIKGLHHSAYRCRDSGETCAFYEEFLGLPLETPRLKKAIKFSSFKVLANQEKEDGFVEAVPIDNRVFFRKGKTGAWRKELTAEQVEGIIERHSEVMAEHGYLNDKGGPRF